MKKNELWTGRCENYTHDGMCVIKKDGFPYFVKGLLKGEKALIRTIKLKKTYGFGKVEELLDESPARAIPPCPLAGRCGGCQLQHGGLLFLKCRKRALIGFRPGHDGRQRENRKRRRQYQRCNPREFF